MRIGIAEFSMLEPGRHPVGEAYGLLGTGRSHEVEVTEDGDRLVSDAGLTLLVELADRAGLIDGLSDAFAPTREPQSTHDPGAGPQGCRGDAR